MKVVFVAVLCSAVWAAVSADGSGAAGLAKEDSEYWSRLLKGNGESMSLTPAPSPSPSGIACEIEVSKGCHI